jgi:hypothetical protein
MEELLSLPFISEFVFRSPKKLDPTLKEVGDLLIIHKGAGVLISQKLQEDPSSRTEQKNELWVRKNARAATAQLLGAIRTANEKPIWCDHPRRGRVDFPKGLPPLRHGVVLVETWVPVDLASDGDDLPLTYEGVPITYMSVNDFVNVAYELRTVPELIAFLEARRTLPLSCLRVVGDDKCLLEMYLLERGTLSGCVGHSDAKLVAASRSSELVEILRTKGEHEVHNSLMEYVADALATRHPDAMSGIAPEIVAAFEPTDSRTRYLAMQEVIADLKLRERAELGRALLSTTEGLSSVEQGFRFRAVHFDSSDRVWVLAASKNVDRSDLIRLMNGLVHGAMAFYEKPNGIIIVDREGKGFEVGLSRPGYQPTEEEKKFGQKTFGNLRVADKLMHIV